MTTTRWALLLLLCTLSYSDEYKGHQGRFVQVYATGYSADDTLDKPYHDAHPDTRHRTANMTDTDRVPYGIAAPKSLPFRTKVIITNCPDWPGSERVMLVDDRGSIISRRSRETGQLCIDLRFKTEAAAREFGHQELVIFVIDKE